MVFRSPLQTPVMKSTGINRQKAAFHRNAAFILLFLMYNKNVICINIFVLLFVVHEFGFGVLPKLDEANTCCQRIDDMLTLV